MLTTDLSRHVGKFYGKYPGIVAEDPQPDALGRIRVTVPSVLGEATLVRARPCMPYGHFFVPAPLTRIWVEFEAGDTRYPIWVGVWYPEGSAPQEVRDEPQTQRVIQTPKGHTVEISDADDAEKIVIRHKEDSFVALQPDGSVLIGNKNGANLYLNAEGGQTTLTGENGHLVTMTSDAMVLANDAGSVLELKGDTVTVLAPNVVLSGTTVALGANAAEPTVMGTAFKTLWQLVVAHTHPTAMGPSGPATPPILPLVDGVHLTSSVVVK
jgi:hypothetical protein